MSATRDELDRARIRELQERNHRRVEETRQMLERAERERTRIQRSLDSSEVSARRARRVLRGAGLLKTA